MGVYSQWKAVLGEADKSGDSEIFQVWQVVARPFAPEQSEKRYQPSCFTVRGLEAMHNQQRP